MLPTRRGAVYGARCLSGETTFGLNGRGFCDRVLVPATMTPADAADA
jgi:hypothetical protein